MHFELNSESILLLLKANAKTEIANVGRINVRVTAPNVMYHGWLETARNPAISVNLLLFLDQEVS